MVAEEALIERKRKNKYESLSSSFVRKVGSPYRGGRLPPDGPEMTDCVKKGEHTLD